MPLDDLLAGSEIVSLHLPLTPETEGLIDARRLALMPVGSILVNTSRGGLVDQGALVEELASGRLGACGLDVAEVEPIPGDDPLVALDNVVVTPHVAWLTWETLERSLDIARRNVAHLRAGAQLEYRVG
jgi:phosphoglycerate dehydrogenase-like enzyme